MNILSALVSAFCLAVVVLALVVFAGHALVALDASRRRRAHRDAYEAHIGPLLARRLAARR